MRRRRAQAKPRTASQFKVRGDIKSALAAALEPDPKTVLPVGTRWTLLPEGHRFRVVLFYADNAEILEAAVPDAEGGAGLIRTVPALSLVAAFRAGLLRPFKGEHLCSKCKTLARTLDRPAALLRTSACYSCGIDCCGHLLDVVGAIISGKDAVCAECRSRAAREKFRAEQRAGAK